jgi:hypothetical protein
MTKIAKVRGVLVVLRRCLKRDLVYPAKNAWHGRIEVLNIATQRFGNFKATI